VNQAGRLARARRLTGSVWAARASDGDREAGHARLRRLAAARSTGILPFIAPATGAIHFLDGDVVHAESARTPGTAVSPAPAPSSISALLADTEPTVDAALDLLAAGWRGGRFRPSRSPAAGWPARIPVETLLAEVTRRQRLLEQMSPVLSADTSVIRHPRLNHPGVRVTAAQWALLIRVPGRATPRQLAWELGRSVFGTTTEVYRLLVLGLLAPASRPPGPRTSSGPPSGPGADGTGLARLSFLRAVLAGAPAAGTARTP
jgi:Domain of unknown function (DUF4388)